MSEWVCISIEALTLFINWQETLVKIAWNAIVNDASNMMEGG
ncbi:hypothetical protein [Lysinibacillus fusiformis]|nr:hypothetical protein [Lysinibacillus fusiformis]